MNDNPLILMMTMTRMMTGRMMITITACSRASLRSAGTGPVLAPPFCSRTHLVCVSSTLHIYPHLVCTNLHIYIYTLCVCPLLCTYIHTLCVCPILCTYIHTTPYISTPCVCPLLCTYIHTFLSLHVVITCVRFSMSFFTDIAKCEHAVQQRKTAKRTVQY